MEAKLKALRPTQTPPAPRAVSLAAKIATLFNTMPLSLYGLGVLCVVSWVMFLVFGRGGTGAALKEALGKWEPYGQARLVSVEETDHSFKGSRYLELSFHGRQEDGTVFSGVSYARDYYGERGDEVEVERLVGTDDVLRVAGASISSSGTLGDHVIVCIPLTFFLVVGVILGIVSPLRAGLRALKFLSNGEIVEGKCVEYQPPPKDRNGEFVRGVPATFLFEFESQTDGRMTATYKSMQPWLYWDRPTAPLLYLPDESQDEQTFFYYDLPKGIYFDSKRGVCGRLSTVLLHFVLLAFAIAGFVATFATTMNFDHATITPTPAASASSPSEGEI